MWHIMEKDSFKADMHEAITFGLLIPFCMYVEQDPIYTEGPRTARP